jgi:hypothetical protein
MDYHIRIEQLIEELRRLVGYGATPHRLPSLPILRHVLGIGPDVPYKTAGRLMYHALLKAIRSLDGTHTVLGREYPALKLRIVLQLLLRYDKYTERVKERRVRAIRELGHHHHVETWRREDGPERYFLAVLAEHLLAQPST